MKLQTVNRLGWIACGLMALGTCAGGLSMIHHARNPRPGSLGHYIQEQRKDAYEQQKEMRKLQKEQMQDLQQQQKAMRELQKNQLEALKRQNQQWEQLQKEQLEQMRQFNKQLSKKAGY